MKLTKMFALLLAIILAVTSIPEYASADSGMIEIGKWDCIYFGRYYQNDTNGDGKVNLSDEMEPVRWRILSRSGNRALLLSDKILDAGKYNDKDENCTWETCGMRKWLNNTFYKTAFDEKEQAAIQTRTVVNVAAETFQGAEGGNPTQDKVYLLSYDEAMNTGYAFEFCDKYQASNTRSASNTAYAATKPYRYSNTESADAWWLRGPGATNDTAMYVFPDGGISEIMDVDTVAGIRPVVYVDLSDDELWSDAGTETAHDFPNEGEINGVESGAEDVPIIPAEPEEDMPGEDLPDESLPSDTPDDSSSDSANPSPSRVAENHLKFMEYSSEGTVESNAGNSHGYVDEKRWAQPVKAYLKETDNGFMRVEAYSDSVVVEEYSDSFQLTGQQKLDMELHLFGGCFCGDSYNFLVFGQNNPDESDETEVVRIVKYDKEWNRLDAASVRGANTSVPFDAGSLRMAESQDMLYIHTCHEMYKSSDGVNH